ncbi:hypothetical protein C943_03852 [Mariniradius saccharolyticus AK6]|uniref:Uncharacterized protein n=1 Tax=Mariniradius saccharolyticus AK6 TaxID=1239962 RepID=M7YA33_9BACT|nr:hypothetical protein C943_03852 [Mariniradius saccharolyticus AK6]
MIIYREFGISSPENHHLPKENSRGNVQKIPVIILPLSGCKNALTLEFWV